MGEQPIDPDAINAIRSAEAILKQARERGENHPGDNEYELMQNMKRMFSERTPIPVSMLLEWSKARQSHLTELMSAVSPDEINQPHRQRERAEIALCEAIIKGDIKRSGTLLAIDKVTVGNSVIKGEINKPDAQIRAENPGTVFKTDGHGEFQEVSLTDDEYLAMHYEGLEDVMTESMMWQSVAQTCFQLAA